MSFAASPQSAPVRSSQPTLDPTTPSSATSPWGTSVKKPVSASHNRRSSQEMDMQRKAEMAAALRPKTLECKSWVQQTLKLPEDPEEANMTNEQKVEKFFADIASGVLLCKVLTAISPDLTTRFNATAKPGSFVARDNVAAFITALKKIGIQSVLLFEPDDLVGRKNDKAVVVALLQLSKLASTKYSIAPPLLVQYEMEIEEQERAQAAMTAEEKQAQEEEEEEEELQFTPVSTPPESPRKVDEVELHLQNLALEAAAAGKSGTVSSTDSRGSLSRTNSLTSSSIPSSQPSSASVLSSPSTTNAAASSAATKPLTPGHTPSKSQIIRATVTKGDVTHQRTGGGFYLMDDVDAAIHKVLQKMKLKVSIRKVQTKNKGRRRSLENKHGHDYRVGAGGPKVAIRLVQGEALVRVDKEWVDLQTFIKDRVVIDTK